MSPERSSTRPPWGPLVASAVVVPTVLAGLTLAWPRPQIEGELTQAAGQALAGAGITGAHVTFSGRDATISGVPAAQRMQAIQAVEAATGVRVAQFPEPGAGGGPGAGPAVAAQPFGIVRNGDAIVLSGVVGSADEKAALVAAATAKGGGRNVVDQLTVTPGAPLPPGVDATSVGAVTAALAGAASDLSASIGASGVTLAGTAADDAAKSAAAAAITAAVPGATVDNQITVSGGTGGTGDLDAAAKQALQAKISALLSAAPITFAADSPALTPQGRATLAKVLVTVTAAPGARLRIDGYVAAGRGNGVLTAQQLSDQRAATVRGALVAGGVPADHLTVTGRGDAPASDGALGRRVDITVV